MVERTLYIFGLGFLPVMILVNEIVMILVNEIVMTLSNENATTMSNEIATILSNELRYCKPTCAVIG